MKRLLSLSLVLLLLLGAASLSVVGVNETPAEQVAPGALAARFETMLNHNVAVGNDFFKIDALLNASLIALRDRAVDGRVENAALLTYVNEFYGLDLRGMVNENGHAYLPTEGATALPAKGFSAYRHTVTALYENEDGTYTVWSRVEALNHDDAPETKEAVSRFAPSNGRFGYVLLACELLDVEPALTPAAL